SRAASSAFAELASADNLRSASRAKVGAGEGNRTLVVSLEGFCSTIELHPHFVLPHHSELALARRAVAAEAWSAFAQRASARQPSLASQRRLVEGAGFEP